MNTYIFFMIIFCIPQWLFAQPRIVDSSFTGTTCDDSTAKVVMSTGTGGLLRLKLDFNYLRVEAGETYATKTCNGRILLSDDNEVYWQVLSYKVNGKAALAGENSFGGYLNKTFFSLVEGVRSQYQLFPPYLGQFSYKAEFDNQLVKCGKYAELTVESIIFTKEIGSRVGVQNIELILRQQSSCPE